MAILNRQPRKRGRGRRHGLQLSRLTAPTSSILCQRLPPLKIVLTSGGPTAELVERRCVDANHWIVRRGPGSSAPAIWAGFSARCAPGGVRPEDLPQPLVQRPLFLERFRQEAKLAAAVASREHCSLQEVVERLRHDFPGRWNMFTAAMPTMDDPTRPLEPSDVRT